MKANATVLNFYREDCGKMDDLHKLNNKLVKSNKATNRDFFILAAAYVATLVLMIYLFIRQGSDTDDSITVSEICVSSDSSCCASLSANDWSIYPVSSLLLDGFSI